MLSLITSPYPYQPAQETEYTPAVFCLENCMHQPNSQQRWIDRLHQRGFNAIYQRSLLYNTCWEDPALDREAMQLQANDRIVMITSAGCNALDYAIDGPKAIHCVDANPRQNALLDLKIAGIKTTRLQRFLFDLRPRLPRQHARYIPRRAASRPYLRSVVNSGISGSIGGMAAVGATVSTSTAFPGWWLAASVP